MAGWVHPSVCEQLVLAAVPQEHCSGMGILLLCSLLLFLFSALKVITLGVQLV